MSLPKFTPVLISTPMSWTILISPARMSRGRRYSGMPVAHHAARLGQFFEDRHLIAFLEQVIGGGEAGRAGTDDGDLFSARFSAWISGM